MHPFLAQSRKMDSVFSLIAFSSSYVEDVIDKKNEFANIEENFINDATALTQARNTLNAIMKAPELMPLSRTEIGEALLRIQEFHAKAYNWTPQLNADTLLDALEESGYLLRTKIRASIELLDQLYQYGEAGKITISELGCETFEEDVPALELPED